MNTDDLHKIAEAFIRKYQAEKLEADNAEIQPNTMTSPEFEKSSRMVMMVRETSPRYFVDLRSNGHLVWSYDAKYAKVIPHPEYDTWAGFLFRQFNEKVKSVSLGDRR
jgi:hypothetical protein